MARRFCTAASLAAAALLSAGCGSEAVKVAEDAPEHEGAILFAQRCGACHSFSAAGTQGSATDVGDSEREDGPNFDERTETVEDVIFAIENGGFSGAIMPENIVTGAQKRAVAEFVAKHAGKKAESASPTGGAGKGGSDDPFGGGDEATPSDTPE